MTTSIPAVLRPSHVVASAPPSSNASGSFDIADDDTLPCARVDFSEAITIAPRRDRAVLTILTGVLAGKVVPIEGTEAILGRARDAHVRVDDAGASRHHARIVRTIDDRFFIEDMGSRNGTFVGTDRVARRELEPGDRIQIGPNYVVQFSRMDIAEEGIARQLYEASTSDALTKVSNRRHFNERLAAEVAYAVRHKTPLSVVLFDVDHFKRFNDTHGHAAGDVVLRILAAQVGRTIRTEDLLARYGGEEFVLLVRGIPDSHLVKLAERVRASVQRLEIPWNDATLRVTISLGVASLRECMEATPDALVALADTRLYQAKHAGRNQVCLR